MSDHFPGRMERLVVYPVLYALRFVWGLVRPPPTHPPTPLVPARPGRGCDSLCTQATIARTQVRSSLTAALTCLQVRPFTSAKTADTVLILCGPARESSPCPTKLGEIVSLEALREADWPHHAALAAPEE